VAFIVCLQPAAASAERCGLRAATLTSAAALAASCALRLVPWPDGDGGPGGEGGNATGSLRGCAVLLSFALNGASGAWFGFGGAVLSEV